MNDLTALVVPASQVTTGGRSSSMTRFDESVRDMVFFRWCKEQFGRSVGDNITWYCDTEYNRYCFKNENDRNYFLLRWA